MSDEVELTEADWLPMAETILGRNAEGRADCLRVVEAKAIQAELTRLRAENKRLTRIVEAADALRDAIDLWVGDYPTGNPEWHAALDGFDAARGPRS